MDLIDSRTTKGILIEVLNHPSITTKEKVMTIHVLNWRGPIIKYLKSPTIEIESESAKLRI